VKLGLEYAVLRVPLRDLLDRNGLPRLSSCNSGFPQTNPKTGRQSRGAKTFVTVHAFKRTGKIVEVVFAGTAQLPDTAQQATSYAGYAGLVIVIDEAETILRMRTDTRGKSLNGIRQIIDAADRYKGLLWVFTGTPEFFDTKRGVAGLQPLHDRIQFLNEGGVVTMRQPQLELKPFDRERLKDVGLRLRQLYPAGDPNIVAQKVTPDRIVAMVDELTKGFGGDVGVVPRKFLRRLVNLFDAVAENPDASLPEPPPTVEEQRASEGKKPYEYEPGPDDDKGYQVTSVEF
jgi:hypothetical protein